ncbi:MAG: M60 family peptidase N-terminal accessory domain-containing protein, partial [Planctomycetota bacterium]
LTKKPKVVRLDRVSIVYPIEETHTSIADPLGGGIYIEVPYEASAGIVKVRIANAVRSPFFSTRSFDKTTLEQWRKTERHHPGPWTDFESDKFMMQVPTKWIYNYDDPVTLVSELFGLPLIRPKTVLYLQIDLIYRGSANFPGYPQSNFRYNPNKAENGNSNHWLLKGPQSAGQTIFHELGHAHLFTKFRGEVEAVVNVPYVAVLNKGFDVDLDTAFGRSFSKPYVSLDQAAIMWMVAENFSKGNPMNISNSPANEVRYQHRGYGKYVEIVKLFGWKALEDFWHSVNLDYLKGIEYPRNSDPTDSRILRMSRTADADLRPLIHFWGIHPDDNDALKKAIDKEELKPSPLIYDRLIHYKSLIPMNNAEFASHAKIVNPRGIRKGRNPLYGEGWYYVWLPKYEESHSVAARTALQEIIDLYFPDGRPKG